ncbi:MAG: AAA family ATPase [Armatimonadota bacterium]|nr:AAA family ATPase [Armatimonadota bacterium]MDR5696749.1 AAA family ATPase [Armatimonadota bacterium]
MDAARIVAVVNQKGGVGKTTTLLNLGAYLSRLGRKVLLVDLDPQGNLTSGLGIRKDLVRVSSYDCLIRGVPVRHAALPTELDRLDVVPASVDLAGAEVELVTADRRELRLREALEPVRAAYEVVLVDSPPSLGLLTVNAMAAADEVLIPIQCEFYALEGLSHLLRTIELIQRQLNPSLHIGGVILTMHDGRTNLSEQVAADVRAHFGEVVFQTPIPRSVRLAEAPSHGKPIMLYDPHSRGAVAYEAVAIEFDSRLRHRAPEHELAAAGGQAREGG